MPKCDVCEAQFDVQRACDVESEDYPELGWRYGYFLSERGQGYPIGKQDGAVCSYGMIEAASYYCRKCWNAACEVAHGVAPPGSQTPAELLKNIKAVALAMVRGRVR